MSREFTDAEKGIVQAEWAETHSTLQILIEDSLEGSQPLAEPIPLHLATTEVQLDKVEYTPWLSAEEAIGPIRESLDAATDGTTANIQNVDSGFGKDYVAQPEILQGALVRAGRLWRSLEGAGEVHRVLFTGIITQASANNREARLEIVHDLEGLSAVGGDQTVTRLCRWWLQGKFRGVDCGYSGPVMICNGLLNHADGCSGKSNEHRHGGFVKLEGLPSVSGAAGFPEPAANQMVRLDSTFYPQQPFLQIDGGIPSNDAANNRTKIKIASAPDDFTVNRHLFGGISPPSLTALGGLGGSGRILNVSGTDVVGVIEVKPGTSPAAGPVGLVRVNYVDPYPFAPLPVIAAGNENAAAVLSRVFYKDANFNANYFGLWLEGAALNPSLFYSFTYHVIGY